MAPPGCPWASRDSARVRRCATKLEQLTKLHGAAASQVALQDEELRQFSTTHRVFFDRLTTPAFVDNPTNIRTLHKMIEIRHDMDSNRITSDEGNRRAAEAALANLSHAVDVAKARASAQAPPPEGACEARVEEVETKAAH